VLNGMGRSNGKAGGFVLTPSEFLDSYCEIGYKKARSPAGRILLLAILAGILIGMGAVVSNLATMNAISDACGLRTDAHGIILSLPVDEVIGLETGENTL